MDSYIEIEIDLNARGGNNSQNQLDFINFQHKSLPYFSHFQVEGVTVEDKLK